MLHAHGDILISVNNVLYIDFLVFIIVLYRFVQFSLKIVI